MVTARNAGPAAQPTLAQLVAEAEHHPAGAPPSLPGAAIDAQTPVEDAHRYMCRRGLQELCVTHGAQVIGVVTLGDVRAACADAVAEDVAAKPSHD